MTSTASASPSSDFLPPARPSVERLSPYVPGEQPTDPRTVKLNTNEFPYPAAPEVIEAIRRATGDRVRVYPNPTAEPLRRRLAERHEVDPSRILVGNGSDEILRLLVHAYSGAGRTMAIVDPTYSLYPVLAAQFETALRTHPLEDQTGLPASLFTDDADLCMLALPNPPLGSVWEFDALRRLAGKRWLLVLDGAYVDFAGDDVARPLIDAFPNVVLTRTFSKSAGLAGMRIGYAIGDPRVIDRLSRVQDSYPVARLNQAAALGALEGWPYYRRKCDEILAARELLTAELAQRGFAVPPSKGNFVFARHPKAAELYGVLKARGVLVRRFPLPGLEDGLRITIGTPAEIERLLAEIDALLKS